MLLLIRVFSPVLLIFAYRKFSDNFCPFLGRLRHCSFGGSGQGNSARVGPASVGRLREHCAPTHFGVRMEGKGGEWGGVGKQKIQDFYWDLRRRSPSPC